ncbi:MAG: hypothetical protein TR69_WS6001000127 [candidate division WS6 bacterium OLB20]|uniref:Uncharacterized protein n=1 Tax=candidate division WS6 bacterium OLB20 TaxID=1617426 RepID=A0A136M025_9BACT|nr:MAG: hypothetical protein TR69_WS6001000127 [candidate division WS6 bacterium OLB20]
MAGEAPTFLQMMSEKGLRLTGRPHYLDKSLEAPAVDIASILTAEQLREEGLYDLDAEVQNSSAEVPGTKYQEP